MTTDNDRRGLGQAGSSLTAGASSLLIHVGNHAHAVSAGAEYGTGPFLWRGRPGVSLIAEHRSDPVTARPAMIDFGSYERSAAFDDLQAAGVLTGSLVESGFGPSYFSDHREPDGLAAFLDLDLPVAARGLRDAGWARPLVPVVVFADKWMTDRYLNEYAASRLADFGETIAVVMASAYNPLGSVASVLGALHLVHTAPNVVPIRSDEAAIGLIAHGSPFGAVGTASYVRHLYLGRGSKNRRSGPGHEVFHQDTMSWIKHYLLDVFDAPTQFLRCDCEVCDGRTIHRFRDPLLVVEAMAHSAAALQLVHSRVQANPDPASAWADECAAAVATADRLQAHLKDGLLGRTARVWNSALQPTT